jgi:UDP-N-acetylmuramoyl-tripeptide--D-alanyl-D-alanine ligase
MFKVNELLKATKGRLSNPIANSGFCNEVKGISIDSRTIKPHEAFIAIKGKNFDGHNFIEEAIKKGAKAIIAQSSNYRITKSLNGVCLIEVKDTIRALGNIAQYQRERFDVPVIAITGSNGKTTAKEMVACVLSKKFRVLKNEGTKNNQIGLPLTLLNLNGSYDFAVLEIGTNHFGEIDYLAKIARPNISIITNIGPSHLEYLKTLNGVLKEKIALLRQLNNPYIAILNADDKLLKQYVLKELKKTITFGFGIKNKGDFSATKIRLLNEGLNFLVNEKYRFRLNTLGHFNIYNALVAITVARILGMKYPDIIGALSDFNFPQNRLKLIKLKEVKFIDDTYNSNPLSLKQALEVLNNFRTKGRKIFVMGDMLELGRDKELFHRDIAKDIVRICDILITVGRLSRFTADVTRSYGLDIKNIFTCASSLEARDILFNRIFPNPDDVVLVKGSRLLKMEEILK